MSESDVDDHGHGDCPTMHIWASWSMSTEYCRGSPVVCSPPTNISGLWTRHR